MKTVMFFFIGILNATLVLSQIQGPRNPSTITNVSIGGSSAFWGFLKNVKASDGSFAASGDLPSVGNYSDYIVATDFGFNIPVGSTISGIVVEAERFDLNSTLSDYSVRIVKGGTIRSTEKSEGAQYPTTEFYMTYGGTKDKWGETWSSVDINSSGFGVAIATKRTASGTTIGGIDHIQITVYYNFFTLPVQLTSFTATKNSYTKSTNLQWSTAGEINLDHYAIERSSNGRSFQTINTIMGRNQNCSADYSCMDNSPLPGVSFYRLKMVGTGGEEKYSKIVKVEFKLNEFSLFPSILGQGENLYVTNNDHTPLEISFFNNGGKKISTITTANTQVPLKKLSLQQGVIIYKIYNSAQLEVGTGRIVIQ